MLGKLLKYDLKWIYSVVVVFYASAFLFSIIARIFFSIDNSTLFTVLGQIASGITIAMVINSLINGIMRSWARFIKNIYKDESYLTHTLPVKKKVIYLSKVLSAIICAFSTIIVTLLCLFICFYSQENMNFIKQSLELAANTYNTTVINLLFTISLVLFLEIIFVILVGYAGIIIGHRFNRNKMVKSIAIAFGLYIGSSVLSLLIIYIMALWNQDMMNLINTTSSTVNEKAIKMIMIAAIAIYSIYNIIYYVIGKKQLEKGINVD